MPAQKSEAHTVEIETTLVMNEFGHVAPGYLHFRDCGIEILSISVQTGL